MRATILSLLPLLGTSALVAADASSVLSGLTTLNNTLKTLDSDVKKVQGGAVGISSALQVQVDTIAVDNQIVALTGVVNNSTKFTTSESHSVIAALNQVTVVANQSLTDTIAQNSTFGGLAPVVLSALYQLKGDQYNLALSFATKLDSSDINQGVTDLTTLNNAFSNAIVAYGGTPS